MDGHDFLFRSAMTRRGELARHTRQHDNGPIGTFVAIVTLLLVFGCAATLAVM